MGHAAWEYDCCTGAAGLSPHGEALTMWWAGQLPPWICVRLALTTVVVAYDFAVILRLLLWRSGGVWQVPFLSTPFCRVLYFPVQKHLGMSLHVRIGMAAVGHALPDDCHFELLAECTIC